MADSRPRWFHPRFALLLPALLLGLGVWQVTRISGEVGRLQAVASRMQASVERLQELASRDPGATVRFEQNGRDYTAADALSRLQNAQDGLRWDVLVDQGRTVAAWAAAAGGGTALALALGCLAAVAAGARRGMASRQALVGGFRSVVRVLPFLLGAITVATAIGVAGAVLFEVGGAWFLQRIGSGEVKLIALGLILVAAALAFAVSSVRQLRRALEAFTVQPLPVLGRAVTPAAAPGLWQFVNEIAARQGATAPDNIVLGMTEGFYVTSSPVLLEPEGAELSGRTLYLPATFLPLLSRDETTAIIAHELAHFTGEDTTYSLHVLPLFASMGRSMEAVQSKTSQGGLDTVFQPAAILARHVLDTFDRVVSHWSRQREFDADRASLQAAHRRSAATALLRTGMGAGIIGAALRDLYERPARAGRDVVGAVLARAATSGFTDPARHLEDVQPHPTDTHPPTRQRIEALGVPVDDGLLAEASRPVQPGDVAFAEGLFTDWLGLHQTLGADLLAVARDHDEQWTSTLAEAANALPDEVEVHERPWLGVAGFGTGGVVLLAAGLGIMWIAASSTDTSGREVIWAVGGGVALVGAVFVALGWSRYRRAKAGPFLVLGRDGFRCTGIAGVVPWETVAGVQVFAGQALVTEFHFEGGAPLPAQTGRRWSVAVNKRRRILRLKGYVPRGMDAQAYLDLLVRAVQANRARELLARREAADH